MTNKSSSGSGDNKMYQIAMAIITTIAAPVIVFFATNSIKNNASPAATVIVQIITATSPAGTVVDAATDPAKPAETETAALADSATATLASVATETFTSTPTLTQAAALQTTQPKAPPPSGPIQAGKPVLVDGLELTISAQDVKMDGKNIRVSVHVKNTNADRRTLAFTPAAISLKDNHGHVYNPLFGDKKSTCKKEDLGKPHTLEIEPQGQVTLTSVSADSLSGWCAAKPGSAIPLFSGPIEKSAKQLEVQINGVGPFKGFQVVIGL